MNVAERPGPRWSFWIDRGGTFTDVIGDRRRRRQSTLQAAVRRAAYADAAVEAMRRMLGVAPGQRRFPAERVAAIKMGTTVATNALLERKGAPTAVRHQPGFADALLIGDQARPDLFALDIVRPAPLYAGVIEADERLDARGRRGVAAGRGAAAPGAGEAAARRASTSVAIAFLHADLNPAPRTARPASSPGRPASRFVALGSEVSPLPRFIPRAETTVADAYLTPVLRAYVELVSEAGGRRAACYFMTSAGGLVRGRGLPRPRRRGLRPGRRRGRRRRRRPRRTAGGGARLRHGRHLHRRLPLRRPARSGATTPRSPASSCAAPMLDVETVAAGGGSILAFDGLRARVGPGQRRRRPGPGRLRPRRPGRPSPTPTWCWAASTRPPFPRVFGPSGDAPLDSPPPRAPAGRTGGRHGRGQRRGRRRGLPRRRRRADGRRDPPHLHRARLRSARPRPDRLRRRRRPGRLPVAEALGVDEILCPRYGSVLSAWGIGQARPRVRQAGLERRLDAAGLARAGDAARSASTSEAVDQLADRARRPATSAVACACATTAPTPPCRWHSDRWNAVIAAFEAAHRRLFGFIEPARIRSSIASVEVGGRSKPAEPKSHAGPTRSGAASRYAASRSARRRPGA